MTIAWFRAARTSTPAVLDDTVALVAALRADHHITLVDQATAHDFVWMHARAPYDLVVYELADTPAHAFVWPYLLHFPGVLRLRSMSLHGSRAVTLNRAGQADAYHAEIAFSDWDMLRAPLLASRLVVVADAHTASRLRADHPDIVVRHAPLGLERERAAHDRNVTPARGTDHVRFASLDDSRAGVIHRAAARAGTAGTPVELVSGLSPEATLERADVIVALDWPATGEWPVAALAAMSRATPAIVLETEATAAWPALDPQTWQPRGPAAHSPVVVSIDPRDEEHSLMLAMKRLAADAALRARIGAAGHAWWRSGATIDHATNAWRALLEEATTMVPPGRPKGWPPHLDADGTARARRILQELGVSVDFLR